MSQVVKPSLADNSIDRRIEAARGTQEAVVIDDMPMEDYHSVQALSGSILPPALSSAEHYRHARDRKRGPPTPTQLLGEQIHGVILEDWLARQLVVEGPEGNWSHKINKDYRAALQAQYPDATIVKPDAYAAMLGLRVNFYSHPVIMDLIAEMGPFKAEASMFFTSEHGGTSLFCKARPDILWEPDGDGAAYHINIKTVVSNEGDTFANQFLRYGYDISVAHYHEALVETYGDAGHEHIFVALERKPPYTVRVYAVTHEMLKHGVARRDRAIKTILKAESTNDYPAYPEAEYLTVPAWAEESSEIDELE
jgi:hypothetical protein